MVKKSKQATTVNLYNFNAEDDEKNRKQNKRKSNQNNKKKSNNKSKKTNKDNNIKNDSKIDLNNEIVIGLPKEENKEVKKQVNKNNKTRNKKKKKNSNVKKVQKPITKKAQEIKRKKIERNLKIAKYTFLSLCILAIIIFAMTSPLFNIKQIIVEGNEKITKDEIISLSQINIEENTYKTNMKKAQKNILENPYIKNVEIKRSLPSKVIIKVEERKATFMLEYGNGYVYVNNQGYILEISSQKLEVPIIQGTDTDVQEFVPGNRLSISDLEKMSTVIKIMELAQNNDISNLITRIDIENKQNYKIVFESEQKVAYLGDETDLNIKIPKIKLILEKENGVAGEIFVNMDMKSNNPIFRQNV